MPASLLDDGRVSQPDMQGQDRMHSTRSIHSPQALAGSQESISSLNSEHSTKSLNNQCNPSIPRLSDSHRRLGSIEKPKLAVPSSQTYPSIVNGSRYLQQRETSTSPPSSGVSGSPVDEAAKKRTSSGTVKLQNATAVNSGHQESNLPPTNGHSRNISVNSTASSVGELSLQLKSRLSHAMVKMQRDRESRPMPAVDSEGKSPTISPGLASAASQAHTQSSQPANGVNKSPYLTSIDLHSAASNQKSAPSSIHNTFLTNKQITAVRPTSNGTPSLAPAADIVPSIASGRRSNGLHTKPPMLSTSRPSRAPNSATAPHRNGTPSTPTPQEQDAVDTLLFMSSPANSSHFPRASTASSQASPRKSQFISSATHETFYASAASVEGPPIPRLKPQTSANSGSEMDHYTHHSLRESKRRSLGFSLSTEKDVDRLLDQMAEDRTTDEADQADIQIPRSATSYTNGSLLNLQS